MTWNGRQLATATNGTNNVSYSYDEHGIRTQKTVNGTVTNYNYQGSALISQVTGNDTLLFSYDAAGNVVAVNYNGIYYYYVHNGQNDVIRLIDGDNNTVVEYAYDSWGRQISCTGSLASTLGNLNPFRYRGYVYDAETGLYYLQTRYYDPEVSRFINADIYVSTGQGVLGHNMYAYCGNNPVVRMDDEGEFWVEILALIVITAFVSATTGCRSDGNCYTYAVGTATSFDGGCYYPGYSRNVAEGTYSYASNDLVQYIQYDLDSCWGKSTYTVKLSNSDELPDQNSWKIAYCYSTELKDFHFFRYDNDKGWSHKQGFGGKPTTEDFANRPIINLQNADRGKYDSNLIYMIITKNRGKIA